MLRRTTISVLSICILSGCVERRLTVNTEPDGVLTYLNNQEIGRTPVTRNFTFYGNFDVQLRKEGYQTRKTSKHVTAPWWQWPPFDLVAELLPLRLQDNREISFTLKPASTQPADPVALLDRAAEMRGKLQSSPNTRRPVPATAPTK
ncbi:MAG: PEGA domain-containing protein [Anaerolineae bacterium]|nr:PEGA domain-containing protein [Phycisphaerae bacterium]